MTPPQLKRILVAEDVRAISMRIAHVLKAHGYEVEVVKDGEECLNSVAASKPDLMILDLMMPKLNGVEVLKTLRANPETERLPVIVCTSKDFSTELKYVRDLGALDVIIKPFEPEFLARSPAMAMSAGAAQVEAHDEPRRRIRGRPFQ